MGGGLLLLTISKSSPHRLESHKTSYEALMTDYANAPTSLTMEEVEDVLSMDNNSRMFRASDHVVRMDASSLDANSPPEDNSTMTAMLYYDELDNENLAELFAAIYDGHTGCQTSAIISTFLVPYLMAKLSDTYPAGRDWSHKSDEVDAVIREAFLDLDKVIMDSAAFCLSQPLALTQAVSHLEFALSGSCALVSYYNALSKDLKIACVGDSRAVLGRRGPSGRWEAVALSADQTGHNADEVARIEREHPNEPDLFENGRLLGLAVTRAFGDSRWKWSRDLQEDARQRFFGPSLRESLRTPPYLTAEPVITTTKIDPNRGDFVIIASDGLWDEMSSQEAVDLVGRWLEKNDHTHAAPSADDVDSTQPHVPSKPRPRKSLGHDVKTRTNRPPPQEKLSLRGQRTLQKDFINKDDNAAVHLIRNALGGSDEERICARMTAKPPWARSVRYGSGC